MSTQYSVEPQPTAKALLKTTSGDILLSLWGQQCPLATRNFLQHCLNGYYDGTIFHRLVPDFILQGGDPTGLGTGGQSALSRDGAPFADEFHPRLRYNRRGLLGMANSGTKDDNGSQFFLTLGATPELQGKNTMFGRVEGDTIFNLMRMGEVDLAEEGGDRPMYPTQITGAEVLVNPFEDMVAQPKASESAKAGGKSKEATKKKRKVGKGALSFGAGEESDAEPVIKRAKVNPSFRGAQEANQAQEKKVVKLPIANSAARGRWRSTSSISERSEEATAAPAQQIKETVVSSKHVDKSPSPEPEQVQKTMSALQRTNEQIAALKNAMKRNGSTTQPAPEKKKGGVDDMIPTTSTRGRKRGKAGEDDDASFAMFNAFKRKLDATPASTSASNGKESSKGTEANEPAKDTNEAPDQKADEDAEERTCDLHFIVDCQSCRNWDEDGGAKADEDGDDDPNWMSHQLSFAKDLLGKDLEWKKKMEEFEVIDPREKANGSRPDRDRKEHAGGRRDYKRDRDRGDRGNREKRDRR